MRYSSSVKRLLKYGAVGGMISLYLPESNKHLGQIVPRFSVAAKSGDADYSQVNDLYQGMGTKWNSDWDKR